MFCVVMSTMKITPSTLFPNVIFFQHLLHQHLVMFAFHSPFLSCEYYISNNLACSYIRTLTYNHVIPYTWVNNLVK
jgi:hypothetical protein